MVDKVRVDDRRDQPSGLEGGKISPVTVDQRITNAETYAVLGEALS